MAYQVNGQSLQSANVGRLGPIGAEQRSFRGLLQPQEQILFCDAKLRLRL